MTPPPSSSVVRAPAQPFCGNTALVSHSDPAASAIRRSLQDTLSSLSSGPSSALPMNQLLLEDLAIRNHQVAFMATVDHVQTI